MTGSADGFLPIDASMQGKKREIELDGGGLGFTKVTGYREGKVSVLKENPHQRIG
jgi:hypothetical protein